MIGLLGFILLTVLVTNGIYTVTGEGFFFSFIGEWFDVLYDKLDESRLLKEIDPYPYYYYKFLIFVFKPIIGCIVCMPSFWSLILWVIFFEFSLIPILLSALSASYINYKLNTHND